MNNGGALQRYVPLVCWAAALLMAVFICLRILSYGYLPPGDARRHAAKPFAGKPYSEIVVMRPEYVVDHSPGWEWFLGVLHRTLGWTEDELLSFSLASTVLAIFCIPLFWVRHPEAWMAAILAQMLAIPQLMDRFAQARPYLLTETILMALLFSWSKVQEQNPRWSKVLLACVAFAFSVWIHGTWYLWVLLFAAFFLARRWRAGLWLSGCWVVGTIAGALLTGRPIAFLYEVVFTAKCIYEEHAPKWMLVGEFQPSNGEYFTIAMLAIIYLWRRGNSSGKTSPPLTSQPAVWMIVINWILGMTADRFWADWGVAGALVWMAGEFDEAIPQLWNPGSLQRLIACGCILAPLYLDSTNDLGRRYTNCLTEPFVDGSNPELKGWMPGPGGIFYADNMQFFYNTFYKNPRGDWRYIEGFEPALMPPDDLKIYRGVHLAQGSPESYEPWVKKMRPIDRLAVGRNGPPNIPELEWKEGAKDVWIGRLPVKK
ncbi:MAG TPA: hypothetical protein VGO59_20510 [Verrucomicrobiae bacterium]|jgi:hypothetical protein